MNLNKDQINKFYSSFLSGIKGFSGILKDETNISTCSIITESPDETLRIINSSLSKKLNEFIEEELGVSAKSVNRNIILFEIEERPNALILRW